MMPKDEDKQIKLSKKDACNAIKDYLIQNKIINNQDDISNKSDINNYRLVNDVRNDFTSKINKDICDDCLKDIGIINNTEETYSYIIIMDYLLKKNIIDIYLIFNDDIINDFSFIISVVDDLDINQYYILKFLSNIGIIQHDDKDISECDDIITYLNTLEPPIQYNNVNSFNLLNKIINDKSKPNNTIANKHIIKCLSKIGLISHEDNEANYEKILDLIFQTNHH